MLKKHEAKYVWKRRRRPDVPRVEKTFGPYVVETSGESKQITLRYDGRCEYDGAVKPHGTIAGEYMWKWNNDGSCWYE